ncbi:OmpA family protein [Ruminococcaceae bacterium OttesenSCG-928-O06]|nr:OmpA family protein [Ruminococcaceae bacterium OttesenSCG-928-O06]
MAKKPKPEGKKYSYMDTYGDLVTLLLCFFVLLFAMSTVEEEKYNAFAEALSRQYPQTTQTSGGPPPVPPDVSGSDAGTEDPAGDTMAPDQVLPADFSQVAEAIQRYVEENGLEGDIQVEVGESGFTFIRLSNNLLFDGDSFILRADVLDLLDFLGEVFMEVEDEILKIRFMGHTAEIAGSGVDDWTLSSARSGGVASYFERTVGFDPYKLEVVAFGRHYPVVDNADDSIRSQNRRVDIVVMGKQITDVGAALIDSLRTYFPEDDPQYFQGPMDDLPEYALQDVAAMNRTIDVENMTSAEMRMLYDQLIANNA